MKKNSISLFEQASRTVKYWWLKLIAGILLIAMGIVVCCYPLASYAALTVFFGVAILISGVVQLALAIASPNYFTSRGTYIICGILDLIIGVWLCCNPAITAITIPFLLGIWAMYRGFLIISFGSDLSSLKMPGSGWMIFFGIILLLLSIVIMVQPFSIGIPTLVILLAISFIMMGITYIYVAFKLKKIHTFTHPQVD